VLPLQKIEKKSTVINPDLIVNVIGLLLLLLKYGLGSLDILIFEAMVLCNG